MCADCNNEVTCGKPEAFLGKAGGIGGYAHLLSAAAQWLIHLEGKRDWEVHGLPRR